MADPISRIDIDWEAVAAESATLLSQYLQFDTSNPPGNERPALDFLAQILRERGFEPTIIQSAPRRGNLIVRLPASGPAQAAPCLLYTHADVVPVNAAAWTCPPFSGQISDGYVWGRGALDNKGQGIIFLQALTLLKQHCSSRRRDFILLVGADEEATGHFGAAWMLKHRPDLIKAEFVWDEGGVVLHRPDTNQYIYHIATVEKGVLTVKVTARGHPGHASIPQSNSPPDRLVQALSRIRWWYHTLKLTEIPIKMLKILAGHHSFPRSVLYAHADKAIFHPLLLRLLDKDPIFAPIIRNTVSLTMLQSGQISNVIPAQAEARLDIRLLPGENPEAVLAALRSLVADPHVSVEFVEYPVMSRPSPVNSDFYRALQHTLPALGPSGPVIPYLTPGATDSRYFRQAGMQAYGFTPMILDPYELRRIHSVDERVSVENLRWGTRLVFETLRKL